MARSEMEVLQCSFCSNAQEDVATLITGPMCAICNECVELCRDILGHAGVEPGAQAASDPDGTAPAAAPQKDHRRFYCSFCGKQRQEVAKLIAGATVFICNECVGVCAGLLGKHDGTPAETRGDAGRAGVRPLTPSE